MSDGEEGGRGGRPSPPRQTPPQSQAATQPPPPPNPPQRNVRKKGSPSSPGRERRRGDPPWQKAQTPRPHPHRTAYEGRRRPQTHQPPQDRHPPPPPDQDRHPQGWGCNGREEGRPSRRSDRRDGRPRPLPHRGREGHRPLCPWAEVWCRLGGIPGRHHPLRGGPAPPLPHARGGRAVPGRGPVGQEKAEASRPHKRRD